MERFLLEFNGFVNQCHEYNIFNVDYVKLFEIWKKEYEPVYQRELENKRRAEELAEFYL